MGNYTDEEVRNAYSAYTAMAEFWAEWKRFPLPQLLTLEQFAEDDAEIGHYLQEFEHPGTLQADNDRNP